MCTKWAKLAKFKTAAIPKLKKIITVPDWKKILIVINLEKFMTVPEQGKMMTGTVSKKTAGTKKWRRVNALH